MADESNAPADMVTEGLRYIKDQYSEGHSLASSYLNGGEIFAADIQPPTTLTIQSDTGRPLVTLHADGTLEYGDGYDPDEAARRFWEAMRVHMPLRCANCGHIASGEGR